MCFHLSHIYIDSRCFLSAVCSRSMPECTLQPLSLLSSFLPRHCLPAPGPADKSVHLFLPGFHSHPDSRLSVPFGLPIHLLQSTKKSCPHFVRQPPLTPDMISPGTPDLFLFLWKYRMYYRESRQALTLS